MASSSSTSPSSSSSLNDKPILTLLAASPISTLNKSLNYQVK